MRLLLPLVASLLLSLTHALQALPPLSWTKNTNWTFTPTPSTKIYVSAHSASHRDSDSLTLTPPSVLEFAQIFLSDLHALFPELSSTRIELVDGTPYTCDQIFLGLETEELRGGYTYEDGSPTEEGFRIQSGECGVEVVGSGARGVWWGTRALLQTFVLEGGVSGLAVEMPAVSTRGFMLDAGRKWYSANFLKELCTYASWFRLSEFHYHASDNYPLNRGRNSSLSDIYSQFSLYPTDPLLQPLITRANETHNITTFKDIQSHCASRGITLIPEIESPGHALAITKWKPQLALANKHDLLNLSHPETIPTVKSIWAEFLPWFQTKEVHIGADEYDAVLADDYVSFVNEMSAFVFAESGKRVRIWGTYEPTNNSVISTDVIIQHWQYGQSDPVELVRSNYTVINSDDRWAYTSLKNDHTPIFPATYPQFFNVTRVLNFGDTEGVQWEPSLFNDIKGGKQVPKGSKRNRGAIMAAWNDNGPDATTQLEAYYSMREGIAVVGARAWSGSRGPKLIVETLEDSVMALAGKAPGQNLDRRIAGNWDVIDWTRQPGASGEARVGLGSKGMNYTLAVEYSSTPWKMSSPYDSVELSLSETGVLTFTADGFEYPLRNIDPKDGYDPGHPGRIWTNGTSSSHEVSYVKEGSGIVVIKTDMIGGSRVWVKGTFMGRFEVFIFGGRNTLFSWSQMAFVAPLELVEGGVERIRLWEGLVDPEV